MSSLWPVSGSAEGIRALLEEWESADDPRPLVIETSGSTGRPKRVMLSRAAMRASADATHARLGGPGVWELNLPPTYVAGVQVLYRTLRGGGGDRRYVSLVPTQLVRAREEWERLTSYDAVLVGGGPLDPAVRAEAEDAGIRVVQTYGMSETCGGCVYDGVPLDGVEVRIEDDGAVRVRGPVLFDGYEGEPERTAEALRDGWLVTNDIGHWAEDGRLRIDGRVDDMIISGGLKIPALAVARLLRRLSFFDDLEVVGAPDPEWGEAVVCVMVGGPEELTDEQKDEILRLRADFPDRAWWPKHFVRVDEIPRLANGKPDRVALTRIASDA